MQLGLGSHRALPFGFAFALAAAAPRALHLSACRARLFAFSPLRWAGSKEIAMSLSLKNTPLKFSISHAHMKISIGPIDSRSHRQAQHLDRASTGGGCPAAGGQTPLTGFGQVC